MDSNNDVELVVAIKNMVYERIDTSVDIDNDELHEVIENCIIEKSQIKKTSAKFLTDVFLVMSIFNFCRGKNVYFHRKFSEENNAEI